MNHCTTTALLVVSTILLLFVAGCTATTEENLPGASSASPADEAYARGVAEYASANYRIAEECFARAYALSPTRRYR